jgi:arginyl-tRNA--protein-N-Asp/Glu arginylyltransferase
MTQDPRTPLVQEPVFYRTPPRACSYFEERKTRSIFLGPEHPLTPELHARLTVLGFRRSGLHAYRPHCDDCNACVPIRVRVHDFQRSRNEQRLWKRNQDLTVHSITPQENDEIYSLYKRYLNWKHPGGGMDNPEPGDLSAFLLGDAQWTRFHEFRLKGDLIALAVSDRVGDGWSAVYTFYDPRCAKRSLGRYALLWEIEQVRAQGGAYLYLGYWIEGHPKMDYKKAYQPSEILTAQGWIDASNHPARTR